MTNNERCCGMQPTIPNCCMQPAKCTPPCGRYDSCCQVVERPVCQTAQHHHFSKVEHIMPVVFKNEHFYHTQHEYVVDTKEYDEAFAYDEYLGTVGHYTNMGQMPVGQAPMTQNQMPMYQGQAPMGTMPMNQGQMPMGTMPMNQGQMPMGTMPMNQGQKPMGTMPMNQGQKPMNHQQYNCQCT
ncbi:MAG: hypothetical protein ACRCS6_03760, partial [Turicibacter sp.]